MAEFALLIKLPLHPQILAKKSVDIATLRVPLKEVICYLSLLEGGRPEDKLECEYADGASFYPGLQLGI